MATGRDLAEQLLRRAADDEEAARAMLSLKAVLAARNVDFPFIHDIGGLADLCQEAGVSLPDDLAGVERLTPYAAGLRYDDDQTSIVTREMALKWATAAVAWARGEVRGEGPPVANPGSV
jgi:HEPN domain-containing protein